jgi:hypothetical protein
VSGRKNMLMPDMMENIDCIAIGNLCIGHVRIAIIHVDEERTYPRNLVCHACEAEADPV